MRQVMAGGRRGRGGGAAATGRVQLGSNGQGNSSQSVLTDERKTPADQAGANARLLAPKHVPVPTIPVDGQIMFEAMSLCTCLITAALQLLNLYKTVWWLPQSYNEYSMNFYLMDPHLLIFILTMVARRFIYVLILRSMDSVLPSQWSSMFQKITRIILLIVVVCILTWCIYHISGRHNTIKVFYLCYPISVYFLMFGTSIGPFFDMNTAPVYAKDDKKAKFLIDKPLHNCSLNATAIRSEVSNLKSDFNRRLQRSLFSSSGSTYLCGIAPVIFVPQQLHFDVQWVVQYILLIWCGMLSAHFAQAFPVRYCDVLHRSALHLGRWVKVEKHNHLPVQPWNDSALFPNGSVVKHNKGIYRSEGLCTVAEPGNTSHYRFHALFNNPTLILCLLLGLQATLVVIQLMILVHSIEWYQTLTMTLLTVTNYYTLFRLARDYLVCWKVYKAEQLVQEKTSVPEK